MMTDVKSLEPKIRDILTAPGTDLTTISAKRVRKQLLELDTPLTPEVIKENKAEIDELIANVYEQVSAEASRGQSAEDEDGNERGASSDSGKRKRMEEDREGDGNGEEVATRPARKKRARKPDTEMTDEELARHLSNEINGRSRSSRTTTTRARGRGGAKRGGKRGAKSAATVDSDGEGQEGSDAENEGKKKKTGRKGGFQKEYALSEPLVAVLHVEKLSRPQVVKQLWDYIKDHSLQNPEHKKEIICDDKFKALFNVDKIDMFRMNKVLGQHLHEP